LFDIFSSHTFSFEGQKTRNRIGGFTTFVYPHLLQNVSKHKEDICHRSLGFSPKDEVELYYFGPSIVSTSYEDNTYKNNLRSCYFGNMIFFASLSDYL